MLQKFKIIKSARIDKGKYFKGAIEVVIGSIKCLSEARKSDLIIEYSEQFYNVIYSYLLSILSRKPLIFILHHIDWDSLNSKKKVWIYKRALNRAKKILCIDSEEVIQQTMQLFPNKAIIPVINGIDLEKYSLSTEKEYDLIFIGVNEGRKGVEYLPQIRSLVKGQIKDSKLLILGKGWDSAKLKEGWIYPGFVSEKEKRAFS